MTALPVFWCVFLIFSLRFIVFPSCRSSVGPINGHSYPAWNSGKGPQNSDSSTPSECITLYLYRNVQIPSSVLYCLTGGNSARSRTQINNDSTHPHPYRAPPVCWVLTQTLLIQVIPLTNTESHGRRLLPDPSPSPFCLIELRHTVWFWDKASLVPVVWRAAGGVWCCQGLMGNQRRRVTPNSDKYCYWDWMTFHPYSHVKGVGDVAKSLDMSFSTTGTNNLCGFLKN